MTCMPTIEQAARGLFSSSLVTRAESILDGSALFLEDDAFTLEASISRGRWEVLITIDSGEDVRFNEPLSHQEFYAYNTIKELLLSVGQMRKGY